MGRETGDLLQGTLGLLILKALAGEERHGYGIARWIEDVTGGVLQVEEGSLYPALQRMLKAGWLTARWGLSASGRRVRIYELTAAGKRHLAREISSFERMLEGIRLVLSPARS